MLFLRASTAVAPIIRSVIPAGFLVMALPLQSTLNANAPGPAEDEVAWKQLDWTEDGWLDGKELQDGKWLKFDADHNGEITKAEFLDGRARERAADAGGDKAMEPLAPPANESLPRNPMAEAPVTGGDARIAVEPIHIEALHGNKWSRAHIIEMSVDPEKPEAGVRHKIHYDGSWNYWDAWVAPDQLRTLDGSPLPEPTPTADDLAVAARVKLTGDDFFLGTWAMGGVPVMNVTKTEKTGDGKTVRETRKMQGGGGRGYIHISADGTYVWAGGPDGKLSGRWHADPDVSRKGSLVLEQGGGSIGDAYMRRRTNAMMSVQRGLGGPTSFGDPVWDDSGLIFAADVGIAFFHGKWALHRNRTSNLLKSDYGLLEIRADGTFTLVDGGKTTEGAWEKAADGEGMVLRDPWGEGDFRAKQDGASAGFFAQGIRQTHIGVSGQRPDPQ